MFRNLGTGLSSDLIRSALRRTREEWVRRYGALPAERLRTEIDVRAVRSPNPGYCYKVAGWTKDRVVRGKLYLWAPEDDAIQGGSPHETRDLAIVAETMDPCLSGCHPNKEQDLEDQDRSRRGSH